MDGIIAKYLDTALIVCKEHMLAKPTLSKVVEDIVKVKVT